MKREIMLAFAETTSNTDTTQTTEANAVVVVTAPVLTLNGATRIQLQFTITAWGQDTISSPVSRLAVFDAFNGGAAAPIGTLIQTRAWSSTLSAQPGGSWRTYFTPAAGTHQFSIRSWVSSASTFRTAGHTAGASVDIPSQLVISAETSISIPPTYGERRTSRRNQLTRT